MNFQSRSQHVALQAGMVVKARYAATKVTARAPCHDDLLAVIGAARMLLAEATAKMKALQDELEIEQVIETLRVDEKHDFFLCEELIPGLWLESAELVWEPRVIHGYYDETFHETVRDVHVRRLAKVAA